LRADILLIEASGEKFGEAPRAEPDGEEELQGPVGFVSTMMDMTQRAGYAQFLGLTVKSAWIQQGL
jgi:hypothetical protein